MEWQIKIDKALNQMDKEYQITYVEKPEESAWGIIGHGVGDYNRQQAGEDKFQRLCFALYSPDQEIVGGVLGEIYWDWFHSDNSFLCRYQED